MSKGNMSEKRHLEAQEELRVEREGGTALRQRTERVTSRKRPLIGTKFDGGAVPPHVQAFISKLESSPFGEPVFSPRRRTRAPQTRERNKQHIDEPCGHVPREIVNRSREGFRISEEVLPAANEGCWELERRRGRASTWRWSGASHAPSRPHSVTRNETLTSGLSAPSIWDKTVLTKDSSCRRPLSAALEEAKLLERLASLSGVPRNRREYPMVDSLKNAAAIEAVQAKLRDCRRRAKKIKSEQEGHYAFFTDCSTEQKAKTIDPPPEDSSEACRWALRRSGSFRKVPKSWDNPSPCLSPLGDASFKDQCKTERPRSASSVLHSSTSLHHPSSRNSSSAYRTSLDASGKPFTTLTSEGQIAAMNLQASFQRLKMGTLIEVIHMHNPPRPVLGVMSALGHLLGFKNRKGTHHRPLFGNAYALRARLAAVFPREISPRRLSSLVRSLESREMAPDRVRKASAAAVVILDWLLAVVACGKAEGICARGG